MRKPSFVYIYLLSFVVLFLSSCSRDDAERESTYPTDTVNEWIDQTMRYWYYWRSEIPSKSNLNFKADPELFFRQLLSNKDGKDLQDGTGHYYYSSINKKSSSTRSSAAKVGLGIHFQTWLMSKSPEKYAVNVLYVLPGSPAEEAGIKRGNWIFKIDNIPVNSTNFYDLMGQETLKLTFGDTYRATEAEMSTATLTPRIVEDRPLHFAQIIQGEESGNKIVGYVVFNSFTSGPSGESDVSYNEELKTQFAQFKALGVEEFVLDLRYNGGGLLTVAKLLSELLAPASTVGKNLCEVRYNTPDDKNLVYKIEAQPANLDLKRLFVLTSSQTASASEVIINCLRPYYDVVLIGERTEGKNVGSITLSSDKYDYEIHPIVCTIYNGLGQSNYSQGFSPDWTLQGDARSLNGDLPFGDTKNDIPLRVALQWMTTGPVSAVTYKTSALSEAFSGEPIVCTGNVKKLIVPLPLEYLPE